MKVIKSFPPNFTKISKAFPVVKGKPGILYAYGSTLYNPTGITVAPWIVAHEAIHMSRQEARGVEAWWDMYLVDDKFRLFEEVLAHRAEYHAFDNWNHNPRKLARYLDVMAERLSGPLYGRLISKAGAMDLIANDE